MTQVHSRVVGLVSDAPLRASRADHFVDARPGRPNPSPRRRIAFLSRPSPSLDGPVTHMPGGGVSVPERGWRMNKPTAVLSLVLAAFATPGRALEAIPEPDVIYMGKIDALPNAATVSVQVGGESVGSASAIGGVSTVRVALVDASQGGGVPAGSTETGAAATLVVNNVPQRALTVGNRGAIYVWSDIRYSPVPPSPLPQLAIAACSSASCLPLPVTPTPTRTATVSPPTFTPTGPRPATPTPTRVVTVTPTGSVTVTATATATRTPAQLCTGDCDGGGSVTVDELLVMVNIALGTFDVDRCFAGDANEDDLITVDEILSAVNNALGRCVR